jgi:hypothetical protein
MINAGEVTPPALISSDSTIAPRLAGKVPAVVIAAASKPSRGWYSYKKGIEHST